MLLSAFDFNALKDMLNPYGYIFAIVAAVLLFILIIVVIASAVKAGRLKRENAKLRERAESDERKLADIARALPTDLAPARQEERTEKQAIAQESAIAEAEPEKQPEEIKEEPAAAEQEEPQSDEETPSAIEEEPDEESEAVREEEAAEEEPTAPIKEKVIEEKRPVSKSSASKSSAAAKSAATRAAIAKSTTPPEADQNKYTVKYDRAKGNWIVVKNGNSRPTRRVATKAEALAIAKELADASGATLSVHKKDGKFQKQ